jgi:RES domain-containing protein
MSVEAFRIVQTRHVATAFDGEGAWLRGGRWKSRGTRVVYTAGSRSLATLAVLVHVEDFAAVAARYSIVPVRFAESLVRRLNPRDLPAGWSAPGPVAFTQLAGDAWVRRGDSAVLAVPSAVIPAEWNYLINAAHPEFGAIAMGAPEPFRLDPRLG